MTTPAAANLYLAQHLHANENKQWAVVNPLNKPVEDLPFITGFNNGGSYWLHGVLLAQDGTFLGSHTCSHEGYMLHDLGILTDTRSDRHEEFLAHYHDGYRMRFVSYNDGDGDEILQESFRLYDIAKAKETPTDAT